jgi:hypothetical protein
MSKPDPSQPTRRKLTVTGNFKEPEPLGVTLNDAGCSFDNAPPKEPAQNPGGRPPGKINEAIQFLTTELTTDNDQKLVDLIEKWIEAGESKATLFRAKDKMEEAGSLVTDSSKKPQIVHLVKSESKTDQN